MRNEATRGQGTRRRLPDRTMITAACLQAGCSILPRTRCHFDGPRDCCSAQSTRLRSSSLYRPTLLFLHASSQPAIDTSHPSSNHPSDRTSGTAESCLTILGTPMGLSTGMKAVVAPAPAAAAMATRATQRQQQDLPCQTTL